MQNILTGILALFVIIYAYIVRIYRHTYNGGIEHRRVDRSRSKPPLFYDKDYQEIFTQISQQPLPPVETFDDLKHSLKYRSNNNITRTSYHIGQRKLFNNELQFLTKHLGDKNASATVVYAGSSPSNHIYYLHTLFPGVKFLLVDPNETIIYTNNGDNHYEYPKDEIIYLRHNPAHSTGLGATHKVQYLQNGAPANILKSASTNVANKAASVDAITGKSASTAASSTTTTTDTVNALDIALDTVLDIALDTALDYMTNSNHRIYIYEDYFTIEIANTIREKLPNVYFWCDIRTNSANSEPRDIDIMWNMAQQYNWVCALRPAKYMLKFRMPFHDTPKADFIAQSQQEPYKYDFEKCDIDFAASYDTKKLKYLDGIIYMQSFAGETSTESRLVGVGDTVDKTIMMREYDFGDYDDGFFYYNNIERCFCLHTNKYVDPAIGFDLCGDCSLEAHIWDEYKTKMDPMFDVAAAVNHMISLTHRKLFNRGHGQLYAQFTNKKYTELHVDKN